MKPSVHDYGRIFGSVLIYLALTVWFGLIPSTSLFLGVPVAAWLFPLFNLGGEIEQAKAAKKFSFDNAFDTVAVFTSFPVALLDIGRDLAALLVTIIVVSAIVLLWRYRQN
jgi:hypothetical protein